MASLNKVFLMGNLTKDPELRYTQDGTPVCGFGLAVNRFFTTKSGEKKENTLFMEITVWRKQAENCAEYLKKGRPVMVEGRLEMDNWENKEGQKRSKVRVVAQNIQFLGGPRTGEKVPTEKDKAAKSVESPPEEEQAEDIPF